MIKLSRSIAGIIFAGILFTPLLAGAQDADEPVDRHGKMLENLLWGIAPFLIFGVVFWFFLRRRIKMQQHSPLVQRQLDHLDREEQHMQRLEQAVERIATAIEKEKPQ